MYAIPLSHPRLRRALERLSDRISEPAAKLWFIKRTLRSFQEKPEVLRETPIIRGWTLYYVALESFAELAWRPGPITFSPQPFLFLYRIRYLIATVLISATALAGYGMGKLAYRGARIGWVYLADLYTPFPNMASPASSSTSASAGYPQERQGTRPEEVWLVETEGEEELWSNGLRVQTKYQSRTEPRNYVLFPRDETEAIDFHEKPVGIVFHTSEYDIAPFRSGFNQEILSTSRSLLRWIARRHLYNYFIDRFGQVYRLVIDAHVATHAGVSIWADEEYVYLNLSDSFLGVCFESRWDPQARGEEILTPAQIQAGLNLTDMLRAQYGISDATCVPHGLISVNPKKMLIGYHTDWAKGFPFGALGLSDKYQVPLPSMVEFGFTYDEHLLKTLEGKIWPGVQNAEIELARIAEEEGLEVSALRRNRRRQYRQQIELLKLAHIERPVASAHP
jgi:hypothetical protein